MNRSRISWLLNNDGTPGYTWSPTTGCSPASSGCLNCWAKAYHVRYRGGDFGVKLHPEKLDEPLRLRKPSTIGVSLMGDLFHDDVPDHFLDRVFAVMAACHYLGRGDDCRPGHTFVVLTKRPGRLLSYLSGNPQERWPYAAANAGVDMDDDAFADQISREKLEHVWFGVSAENQATLDARGEELINAPVRHRFVSLEPQLEAVDFGSFLYQWQMISCDKKGDINECPAWGLPYCVHGCGHGVHGGGIELVIQGCESGQKRRPFDVAWARSVRDQCRAAGVCFYLKQMPETIHGGCSEFGCDEYGDCTKSDAETRMCPVGRSRDIVRENPYLDGRQHLDLPWVKP